jgi:hypothetical protein
MKQETKNDIFEALSSYEAPLQKRFQVVAAELKLRGKEYDKLREELDDLQAMLTGLQEIKEILQYGE